MKLFTFIKKYFTAKKAKMKEIEDQKAKERKFREMIRVLGNDIVETIRKMKQCGVIDTIIPDMEEERGTYIDHMNFTFDEFHVDCATVNDKGWGYVLAEYGPDYVNAVAPTIKWHGGVLSLEESIVVWDTMKKKMIKMMGVPDIDTIRKKVLEYTNTSRDDIPEKNDD